MRVTQVGSPAQENQHLFAIKAKLRKNNLTVNYPTANKYILLNGRRFVFNPQRWSKYEVDVHYFTSIKTSNFHIVEASGLLDNDSALSILAAMRYHKPIILTHEPRFSKTVGYFTQSIIKKQGSKLRVSDLAQCSDTQLMKVLDALPTEVDYNLTSSQTLLIKTRLKAHFRQLLQPARKPRTYHAEHLRLG